MAYIKNIGVLKQFNDKDCYPSQYNDLSKQETNINTAAKINETTRFAHNPTETFRVDSVFSGPIETTSRLMFNNIVPNLQHVPIQPVPFKLQTPRPQDITLHTEASDSTDTPLEASALEPHFMFQENNIPTETPEGGNQGKSKDRPYECKICSRRFRQKQTLKQHTITHTGQRPFECNQCFKAFTQQGALQRHVVIHTGEKPFPCTLCGLSFRQKINLQRHVKLHTGAAKEYQCSVCKREFSRKGALLRHEPIHESERPRLQCACCKKLFLNKESLVRHEKNQELREKGVLRVKARRNGKLQTMIINCILCGKLYRRSQSILTVLDKSLASACLQCSQSTPRDGTLRESEVFQCNVCQSIFHKSASYERHKLLHSSARQYECDICHFRFKEKRFLRTHVRTHCDAREQQCHICGLSFKYAYKLKAHYVSHVNELGEYLENYVHVFTCHFCDQVCYQRNVIIRHLKTHKRSEIIPNNEPVYEKDDCKTSSDKAVENDENNINPALEVDNGTAYPDTMSTHEDSISNDSDMDINAIDDLLDFKKDRSKTHPFYCYVCKRSYTKKRSLNRHFRVAHTNYEKFPCKLCSKTFQTKNSLKAHYVLHKPHRFQCDLCDKTFNRKDALASHKLIHSDKKSFLCPYCPKSFFQKQSLHTHLIQHKGDKGFDCGVCGKSFYERSTLNRHYLTHSGERKFSCHICNMSFIQKNHLDKHFLRHDEIEKKVTFPCSDCGKLFFRKDHYQRHCQSHKSNRVLYPCELCGRQFTDKYSLARHVKLKKCEEKKPRGRKKIVKQNETDKECKKSNRQRNQEVEKKL